MDFRSDCLWWIFFLHPFLSFVPALLLSLTFPFYVLSGCCKKLSINLGQSLEMGPGSIIGIIHWTHYQYSDWSRTPCLFWEFTWFCGQATVIQLFLQIIPRALRMRNTPLAKEREHLNCFEWWGHVVICACNFRSTNKIYLHFHNSFLYIFHTTMHNKTIIEFGFCDIRINERFGKLIIPDITKNSSNYCL